MFYSDRKNKVKVLPGYLRIVSKFTHIVSFSHVFASSIDPQLNFAKLIAKGLQARLPAVRSMIFLLLAIILICLVKTTRQPL
jgi:hypothetical protein